MSKPFRFRDIDWLLLGLAIAIAAIGVIEIYSTTAHSALEGEFKKTDLLDNPERCPGIVISRFDYHFLLEQTPWLYLLSVLVLGELLVAGHAVAKTKRWLRFGGLTFQVSEIVKLVIILCVAAYFAQRRGNSATWADLVKLGLLAVVPAILVALEPDLGTALTFFAILGAGILLAGIRWRQVAVLLLLGVLCLPVGWHFLRPYQRDRFMTYFHPSQDMQGTSYQVTQTKIAIGSGGLSGVKALETAPKAIWDSSLSPRRTPFLPPLQRNRDSLVR